MAEQIVNEFTVNRSIDEAWPIICDLERIAPCLPGAQLEEIEGDIYRGRVKVKLGAITAQFVGEAHFVERDDAAHTAKLKGKGRDTGGRGNAEADISAHAEALSPTSTKCTVVADLHITGKVAQFGRGIMGDVSKKLIDQFSSNLNTMLDDSAPVTPSAAAPPAAAPPAAASPAAASSATSPATAADTNASSGPSPVDSEVLAAQVDADPAEAAPTTRDQAGTPTVRKIDGPAAEPIDMAGMAGPALLKRLGPAVAAVLLLLLLLRRRK